ncbi:mycothiol system anti-sigma-R factor [Aeromicrobium fastidiosum]|uniref:Mycothiol system anti-sigma-R factor n=1 Tax=Aeromicrobium fastidiosum TaxID=52699 RepID=A0A641AIC2_9ACTN|nr:mycothiol system anti-sigma-R factor [Aeromicrobium fastidiosum]KAA1373691.1 mycothiol system anti-sigma-R factor [Aeromicrobium fastidiosum]MBP2391250.1 mycothiol system anti-sigma-R factor [Aeromicrobium fastidiosum]
MSANPCEGPDCEQALDKLYLFIDQEIDTASCAEIQTHIDECTSCLSEYDLERVVKSLVSRSCSEVAPDPLREKVLLSIRTVQVQITEQRTV